MKTKSILFLLFVFSFAGHSQSIVYVNFDEIKEHTQDSSSHFYYPSLISRLHQNDTSLTSEEYHHLYFGNVFTDSYSPYSSSDTEDKFIAIYNKKKYKKAIPIGRKALVENPINLKLTFKMLVCFHQLGMKDSAEAYARRYYSMLDAIYQSGDGKSISTAYVVVRVSDEYQVLYDLELNFAGQALLEGPTDMLSIDTKSQEKKKGKKKIKELYFNVYMPMNYLTKQFEKE